MRLVLTRLLLGIAGSSLFASLAGAALPAADQPAVTAPAQPIIPESRMGEGWWADRHTAILARLAQHPDPEVVLIGDSITNNYDKSSPPDENFLPTWTQFYAPRRAINLGFSGDTTSNVLWRLANGEVAGIAPKVAVLLIGTNDTGHMKRDAATTQNGIEAVVADLKQRLPTTRILLVSILPSRITPEKSATDAAVNAYIAKRYDGDPRVTVLDIASVFYRADGSLDDRKFYDPRLPQHGAPLHPDTIGQRQMAEAIEPTLARMLGKPPVVALDAMTDVNTALIPVARLETDSYDWFARHRAALALAPVLKPKVVLIGDSITQFWAGPPQSARSSGPQAWQKLFANAPVLNLGFGWDRTQNVLWRLQQGEFDGLDPRWVIVNIGTNNLTGTAAARTNTPEETAAGITAVVNGVRARAPRSRIVLMGIFPRGTSPADPLRIPVNAVNRLLAQRYANDRSIVLLDIGNRFLTSDGTLPVSLMPDGTHPAEAGYAIWAKALRQAGVKP